MFRSCSLVTCKIMTRDSRILIKAQTVLIRHRAEGMLRRAAPPTTSHTRLPRFTAARDRLAFSRHGRAGRGCYDNRLEATVIGHIKPDAALRRRLPTTSSSARFAAEGTSTTDSFKLYSCTSAMTLPMRLRISISDAAFVLNLDLPVRASVTHRWTVAESKILTDKVGKRVM